MALCSGQASPFLPLDIVILCLTRECITMARCVAYIHELCMTLIFYLNIKIIFSTWIWFWQDVFALWKRHTKFWHMGVSPCFTLVWTCPLIYMWVAGVFLVSFTHWFFFYLVFFSSENGSCPPIVRHTDLSL